jgi:putative endonuclease
VSRRRRLLGTRGEDAAAAWYEARGYVVVARNWRCREGELDLVVAGHGQVVFCEVKTRTSVAFGTPAEAVTRAKQLRVRRLATRWLQDHGAPVAGQVRFDVASVMAGTVDVLEGAF